MARKKDYDPLEEFRSQVRLLVPEKHKSFDSFCLDEIDIPPSTMSRLLSGQRTDFRLKTLQKIATGLGKKLVIRME